MTTAKAERGEGVGEGGAERPVPKRPVVSIDPLDDIAANLEYQYGFVTDVDSDEFPHGLNESVIKAISQRKGEPEWLLQFRLSAFDSWKKMEEPHWGIHTYPRINYQGIVYYSAPSKKSGSEGAGGGGGACASAATCEGSCDGCVSETANILMPPCAPEEGEMLTDEVRDTFERLGISLAETQAVGSQSRVAVDAVFDSVSVATTFKEHLAQYGVIFLPFSEAVRRHPRLVKKWLGFAVPPTDSFFVALNSAVFSDGSFVYIPPGVHCPIDLSSYFRINAAFTGQFERTLIVADVGSSVSYLEGCTASRRDNNQLHAAVVELVALDDAYIKYATVQNWYPGDPITGRGGIYNFVTKRGRCVGTSSRISWTQVESGSAITWKYPSCILEGAGSRGEFYSVAVTNNFQQADTGTRMVHVGPNTRSTIISKGISAGRSQQAYRGLVKMGKHATNARNFSQCDSLLVGDKCGAHTFPTIETESRTAHAEHEASTSKISEDQLFYCQQRGISAEDAVNIIVNGFCKDVFLNLPMEFAAEAEKLLAVVLEGAVG